MDPAAIVFTDVDGTLTLDRKTSVIDLSVIGVMRDLVSNDYLVVLVSGNSLPVLRGVSLYLGLRGYVIAENGAVIYVNNVKVTCGPCDMAGIAHKILFREAGHIFRDSWQNMFRICDKALKWTGDECRALETAREILRKHKIENLNVVSSGYAIHIHPQNCNKGVGIREFIKELGATNIPTYCIGDAENDLPMRNVCSKLIAVGNADPKLKEFADEVMINPSAKGFIEFAHKLKKGLL